MEVEEEEEKKKATRANARGCGLSRDATDPFNVSIHYLKSKWTQQLLDKEASPPRKVSHP